MSPFLRGWRVWTVVGFGWPLAIDLLISLFAGRPSSLIGSALGLGLLMMAALTFGRGRAGDSRRGSILVGAAAGIAAGMAAHLHPIAAVMLGFGAFTGARLLTDDLPEQAAPPPPPAPAPEPVRPMPSALQQTEQRLADLHRRAVALPQGEGLDDAVLGLSELLMVIARRPDSADEARRFLNMHMDGLERMAERLEAGAEPPERMAPLLADIAATARDWRIRLRARETEALDIQVKVMSDRLKEDRS
ncbi:hypothetical protein EOD42_17310 [Rhodovarius crocodyli]|uniref:Uncharacterized protein n=1 Tax=Rhodovarius crocodyli TaxID=1979269 RepID=A0A437MCH0_9PROT|nr:hypothetical protein [Rhodovarius crocodyli]RVT95341.1 hypothetical protein EOD42_17310 [Rhodovarius crocodyli]